MEHQSYYRLEKDNIHHLWDKILQIKPLVVPNIGLERSCRIIIQETLLTSNKVLPLSLYYSNTFNWVIFQTPQTNVKLDPKARDPKRQDGSRKKSI